MKRITETNTEPARPTTRTNGQLFGLELEAMIRILNAIVATGLGFTVTWIAIELAITIVALLRKLRR